MSKFPKGFGSPLSKEEADRYLRRNALLVDFAGLFDYDDPSDRAIAVVGSAFLDMLLSDILREFLVDDAKEVEQLLAPEGPLGTFGSRVRACYCLGLIGPVIAADLRLVGKIRNQFAHELQTTFSDQRISQWCKSLQWHKHALFHDPPAGASERDLFQVGVNQLVTHLIGLPGLARADKRVKREDV